MLDYPLLAVGIFIGFVIGVVFMGIKFGKRIDRLEKESQTKC